MSIFYRLQSDDHYFFISKAAIKTKSDMKGASNRAASASSSSSDDSNTFSPSASMGAKSKPPSASVLTPSPASINASPLSSFKIDFLTKSTIYRRHEARLARSYALRDDPRPIFIRVMSGLPGFRMIFPPYRSESKKCFDRIEEQNKREKMFTKPVVPGVYSEETLFDRYSDTTDNAVGPESTGLNDANEYENTFSPEHVMQAVLAAGSCSGTAEYILAYCNIYQKHAATSPTSPFQNSTIAGSMTNNSKTAIGYSHLFFRLKSSVASNITGPEVYNEIQNAATNSTLLKTTNNSLRPSTGAFSKALSVAFPTSLLFGAKVFLESVLENQQNNENARPIANSILSSAFAGGMVGTSRLALLQVKHRKKSSPSSLSMIQEQRLANGHSPFNLIRRNILAAILYFSIYDGVSSIWSSCSPTNFGTAKLASSSSTIRSDCSCKKKGTLEIVVGGALAGVAHAATMNSHRYGQYGSMIWWSRIMMPAISRAAPIHAFVFYGYEKMKDSLKAVS